MARVNLTADERARKMHALFLRRLAGSQASIAAAMGKSESTISRLKNDEHLLDIFRMAAHGGLKLVPVELKCYDSRQLDALFIIARDQWVRADSVDDVLRFDEDPE